MMNSSSVLLDCFRRLNLRTNYSSFVKRAVVAEKLISRGIDLTSYMTQQRLSEEVAYARFLQSINEDVLGHPFGIDDEYIYM